MGTYDVIPVGQQVTSRPQRRTICAAISMLFTVLILGFGLQAGAQSATIDFSGANRNWITGLGGGVVYLYGPNFTAPMSSAMADDLFCTGDGQLGLSLLRISIDPGGQTAVPILQGSPYGDGYGWAPEVGVAQLAQSEAASCASPGQVSVFATPWSVLCNPTTCYKTNGSVDGGYLNSSDYSNFAGWLEDFVQYAQSQSVNLTAVSLQNEPNNQTSTPEFGWTDWTATEFENWFDDSGVESDITSDPYHTRIMFPEDVDFTASLADPTLHDTTASQYVGIDGGHCYAAPDTPVALDYYATSLGIPEWVTECDDGSEPVKTAQTWAHAIDLARSVNAWMNAGYNAWGAWEIEDGGPTFPNDYWSLDPGFIYPNSSGNPVIEMKGYAMGQYSKYVRPGYMNVSVPTEAYVEVSAYQGAGNFVIVAINNHSSSENTNFTIENATISSLNVYQSDASSTTATSCTDCLASGSPSTVTPTSCSGNLCFTYDMPAYSIVTFVGTGVGTAANMITNPRFATGDLAGWAVSVTGGDGSAADVYVKKDTSCCSDHYELEEKGTSFKGWARNIVDVPGGDNFTYTVQARSNGSHGYVQLLEVGGSTNLCTEMNISGTSWTQYTCSGTMPNSGSKQLLIRLASSGLTSTEYVDYGASDLTISAP